MPTHAQKQHRIGTGGPWGSGLLLLGTAVCVQGIGYTTAQPNELSPALAALSDWVPPFVWGLLWIVVGGFSVWKALTPPQRHWHVLPVISVLFLWSAAYLLYWLLEGFVGHGWDRSWQQAVGWGMLAGLIACWGRCVNPPAGPAER